MYEKVRFSGRPCPENEFNRLMAVFAQLLEGIGELRPEITAEIRAQAQSDDSSSTLDADMSSLAPSETAGSVLHFATPDPPRSVSDSSSARSPVTARTAFSRAATPYLQEGGLESEESFNSVIRLPVAEEENTPTAHDGAGFAVPSHRMSSTSLTTLESDVGSVLHHRLSNG
jgi:hypothetical protein